MKRLLIILSAALLLISCSTDYEETNIKVINLQVNSNNWVENTDSEGLNRYYSASFNMPEITSTVYDWGNVNAYITFDQAQ